MKESIFFFGGAVTGALACIIVCEYLRYAAINRKLDKEIMELEIIEERVLARLFKDRGVKEDSL